MDWTAAIEKNQAALKRVLAALVTMTGLAARFSLWPDGAVAASSGLAEIDKAAPTISPQLRRAVLGLLRPAEAAARRLVVVMARDLVVAPARERQARRRPRRKAGGPGAATPSRHLSRPPVAAPARSAAAAAPGTTVGRRRAAHLGSRPRQTFPDPRAPAG